MPIAPFVRIAIAMDAPHSRKLTVMAILGMYPRTSIAGGVLAIVLGAGFPVCSAAADDFSLKIRVDGFKRETGQVFVCLWENETNFPKCEPGNSARRIAVKITGGIAEASFDGLVAGKRYAVSVHHDENGNGIVEKSARGISLEGIGISGNPLFTPVTIGFSRNSFEMKPKPAPVVIHIKHM